MVVCMRYVVGGCGLRSNFQIKIKQGVRNLKFAKKITRHRGGPLGPKGKGLVVLYHMSYSSSSPYCCTP